MSFRRRRRLSRRGKRHRPGARSRPSVRTSRRTRGQAGKGSHQEGSQGAKPRREVRRSSSLHPSSESHPKETPSRRMLAPWHASERASCVGATGEEGLCAGKPRLPQSFVFWSPRAVTPRKTPRVAATRAEPRRRLRWTRPLRAARPVFRHRRRPPRRSRRRRAPRPAARAPTVSACRGHPSKTRAPSARRPSAARIRTAAAAAGISNASPKRSNTATSTAAGLAPLKPARTAVVTRRRVSVIQASARPTVSSAAETG